MTNAMGKFLDDLFAGRINLTLILLLIPMVWILSPQAKAQQRLTSEASIEDLEQCLLHADEEIHSGTLTEEERARAAREGELALSLLTEKAKMEGDDWKRIGVFFYNRGYLRQMCDLWTDRLPDILDEEMAWHASLGLWYLSGARRYVGDWAGAIEVLEAMDRNAARDGLEEDVRSACQRVALSERIRYWLAVGEYEQAVAHLPDYEALNRLWPDFPEARLDLVVRVYGSSGSPRAAMEEFDAFLQGGGTLTSTLSLMRAGYGLTMASHEEADPAPWILALHEALASSDVKGRERVKAAYDLFGAYIAAQDFEGARWCLDDMQRSIAPRSAEKEADAVLEDSSLLTALDLYLCLKTGAGRSLLERRAGELDEIFDRLMRFRIMHPFDERGSALARYPRQLAIFGTLVETQTELYGEAGAISAIERISVHHTFSALSRRMGVKPCSFAEVRNELLLGPDHGVLLLQRAPKQTGGCRLFAFDRERIRWVAIGSLVDYIKRIKRLIVEIHSPQDMTDQWESLSQQYVEWLLPPPIRELFDTWERVTLVGFDGEPWFPFECLMVDGSILGATKAVNHLPSLPLGMHLVRSRAGTQRDFDKNLLLVVAPEHSAAAQAAYPELESLTITDDQIQALTTPFPSESVHMLARKQATLETLMEVDESFALLHILAHGVAGDPLDGAFSDILLGSRIQENTGILDRRNVAELPRASAVFLSACSAGQGVIRTMEGGLNNLGGAFIEHGAEAVVFSHEDLLSGRTIDLMALVSGEVARGSSLAAALRSARQELVRRGLTDPRLHSTLRVWGLGQRPVFASPCIDSSASMDGSGAAGSNGDLGIRIGVTAMILCFVAVTLGRRGRSVR